MRKSFGPAPIHYLIDKLHRAGAQNNLSQLVLGLDRSRYLPSVCCLARGGPLAGKIQDGGVDVTVLGVERIYTPRALFLMRRFAQMLRSRNVRILHTYLVSSNIFGTLAGRMAGVPVILTTRRDMGFSRNARLRWVEETLINPRVTGVVTPCEAVSGVTRREKGLAPHQVVTIPNGIDVGPWKPDRDRSARLREQWRLLQSTPVVGVIANFLPIKGHADFLHAAARVVETHPEAIFFLIGEGHQRRELEGLSEKLGVRDRVVFTGTRDDIPELLSLLDVLVVPSHSEGMSNVLLEAMASTRPIVATAVGGNNELVQHEETGLLVPPQNPAALAAAIGELLENREKAASLGRSARQWVEAHLTVEKMIERHQDLYDELLSAEVNREAQRREEKRK